MPLPADHNRIERSSMRDEVYDTLLDWIMEGVLLPGEKIVDKTLARHLGVSRTPVREALRRLEDKDLVESAANRWTRVSKIPSKELEMIYPIIWTLERLAMSLAIFSLTPKDFLKMDVANGRLEKALEKNDPVMASKADADFHSVFIDGSKNDLLKKTLTDLKNRYRRLEVNYFKNIPHTNSSIKEHEKIILALKNKDMDLAGQTLCSNWEKSLERLRAMEKIDLQ